MISLFKNEKYGRPTTMEDVQSCNDNGVIHKTCKENLKERNKHRKDENWREMEFGLYDGTGDTEKFHTLPIVICERILSWYDKTIATMVQTNDALKAIHKERLDNLHEAGFEVYESGLFVKTKKLRKKDDH